MALESRASAAFAGREAELGELEAGLEDAIAGCGRVFLLHGEGGIGKTTLTQKVSGMARARDVRVIGAYCWDAASAPVFWPWAQVLRPLAADEAVLERLDPATRARVTGLLAGLGEGEVEEMLARVMLFDAVTQLVRASCQSTPMVVVIEDLHEADVSSLQLLHFAAQSLRDVPCLLIGTFRDVEMRMREEAAAIIDRMAGQATSLELTGLSGSQLSALLEDEDPSLGDRLEAHTGGNPFFAIELLRLLRREGRVQELAQADSPPVPPTVRATLARRLEHLSPPAREALEVLSVAGAHVERLLARELLGDAGLAALLEEARPAHLLEGVKGGSVRFAHALVQAAVQDTLPPARLAELDRRVAEAIRTVYAADLDPHLAALSHHLERAGEDEDRRRALTFATAAGARAHRMLAYEDAARQYERAVALADSVDLPDRERAEILLSLGETQMLSGQVERGRATYEAATKLAVRLGDGALRARAAAGYSRPAMEGGVVNQRVVQLIEAALPGAPATLRPRLRARLAAELMFSPETARRETIAREALAEAREGGDPRTLMFTLRGTQAALARTDNAEECLELLAEAIDLGRDLDDLDIQVTAMALATPFLVELGRRRELRANVAAMTATAARVPSPLYRWFAGVHAAREALMRGELEAAGPMIQAQVQQAGEVPNALPGWLNQMLYLNWELGKLVDLEPIMEGLITQRPGLYETIRAWRPLVKAERGSTAEALADLRAVVADLPDRPGALRYLFLLDMAFIAEAAVAIADPDCAAGGYDALEPCADRHHHAPVMTCVTYWGSVQRHLGNLAYILGRHSASVEHHRAALEAHTHMEATAYATHSQFELGRALQAVGRTGEARELIDAARAQAARFGMVRLLARIDDHASPAPAASGPAPTVSARLEGEYWTIESGGRTVRLKNTKGLHYLLALVRHPGKPLHVLELQAEVEGTTRTAGDGGAVADAGLVTESADGAPVLDAQARAAYTARAAELREEIEEAQAFNDPVRAERAAEELQFLEDEMRAALGLGGRERKLGRAPAEQARVNVTKAIRNSIRRVEEADPELGRHLRACVRTGMLCTYSAEVEPLLAWDVARG